MQALLASLVISMGVKDAAFKSGMATARSEAKRTGQEFQRSSDTMQGAVEGAAREINASMVRIGESVVAMGQKVQRAGLGLTAGLTVPLGLMGKSTKDTAATFEQGMNRVRAALLSTSAEDIDKLAAAAMQLGPTMGRSSIEAASAIEMLAKNGMSAAQILGGGLDRAEPRDLDEGLDRPEWRQSAHEPSPMTTVSTDCVTRNRSWFLRTCNTSCCSAKNTGLSGILS